MKYMDCLNTIMPYVQESLLNFFPPFLKYTSLFIAVNFNLLTFGMSSTVTSCSYNSCL